MSEVKVIKAKKNLGFDSGDFKAPKKRVCAYCRVSHDDIEQQTSYKYQIDEYTKKIGGNPDWTMVKIYSDEGISGTSTKRRVGFNQMIEDAKAGKIDLIMTKSVSRFARNTELVLRTIRELKAINVEVFFEKENISSFDSKIEFILTMVSSIAQEEARSTSENVKWTFRKKMREGKPIINCKKFLGYDNGPNGTIVVEPEGAKTVKLIYKLYTGGVGVCQIKRILEAGHYKTGAGLETWEVTTIQSMLKNEKYVGDLLLQKTVTTDYLSHTRVKNTGQEDQYYWSNAHEAIIDRDTWNLAQQIRRTHASARIGKDKNLAKYTNRYPFSGFIMCIKCGRYTRRRYWNYGTPAQRVVQLCGSYLKGNDNCDAKGIDDELVRRVTIHILNTYYVKDSNIIETVKGSIMNILKVDNLAEIIKNKELVKEKYESELSELLEMKLNKTFDEKTLEKKYKDVAGKLKIIIFELEELQKRMDMNAMLNLRAKQIDNFLETQKNGITELTSTIVQAFFYKMLLIDREHLVYLVSSNKEYSDDEIKKKRHEFAESTNILLEGKYTDETYSKGVNYKVVMI